jgi:hypothetical protein
LMSAFTISPSRILALVTALPARSAATILPSTILLEFTESFVRSVRTMEFQRESLV